MPGLFIDFLAIAREPMICSSMVPLNQVILTKVKEVSGCQNIRIFSIGPCRGVTFCDDNLLYFATIEGIWSLGH